MSRSSCTAQEGMFCVIRRPRPARRAPSGSPPEAESKVMGGLIYPKTTKRAPRKEQEEEEARSLPRVQSVARRARCSAVVLLTKTPQVSKCPGLKLFYREKVLLIALNLHPDGLLTLDPGDTPAIKKKSPLFPYS